MEDQGVSIATEFIVRQVGLPEMSPYEFTYYEALDATLLLYGRETMPDIVAELLGHTGGFPAAPSFIEGRVMGLGEPVTSGVALAAESLALECGHVVCPEEFAEVGHRSPGMPLLWNGHCDALISEMDEEDWVIRNEIQQACEFEPEIKLEVIQKRLIDLAPYSRSWVSKVPYRKGLVQRTNERYKKWQDQHIDVEGRGMLNDDLDLALDSGRSFTPGSLEDIPSIIRQHLHPATRRAIERLPDCSVISRTRVEELITSRTRDEEVLAEEQRLLRLVDDGEIERLEYLSATLYLTVALTAGSARGFREVMEIVYSDSSDNSERPVFRPPPGGPPGGTPGH